MRKSAAPVKKTAARHDKYFLRDLHQEIDLYDRKLAYLKAHVEFASAEDRKEAESRLLAKRAPLERTAIELATSGVDYDDKDLPRSFRAMNLAIHAERRSLTLVKSA